MRKAIENFVDVILHLIQCFLTNAITVPFVGYIALIALNSLDSSDFGFVVDERSLLFGLCFGLVLYAVLRFIIDALFKSPPDYCSEFKNYKRKLGGHGNG